MTFENKELAILDRALSKLKSGFNDFPDTLTTDNEDAIERILHKIAIKMHDNYPYPSNNYAGQMLKPPHAIARLAYSLALYINPNNHALDGSRASSPMEKSCVQRIAAMMGWSESLGHLTSGGTMANLEALWIAGKIHPDKKVVASEFAHYTHRRITEVLNIEYQEIPADNDGRMCMLHLITTLKTGTVGTVVVTLGTTGMGMVDALEDIIALKKQFNFRIHIDAAYGGYFKIAKKLSPYVSRQFAVVHEADSIVIDPHKHGLQPYGCGCILFKDTSVGQYYLHDSPYTYFSSEDLHLGEISLECSRAGASAVALWATMELYPLFTDGEFANQLDACLQAAIDLQNLITYDNRFITIIRPELDIVVWGIKADSLSEMTRRAQTFFKKAADQNLHLALIKMPANRLPSHWSEIERDQEYVTCLRSCLMKPTHEKFIDEMWRIIQRII